MPIYHGSNKVTKIYHGGVEIDRVYHGSVLVYSRSSGYVFPTTNHVPVTYNEVYLDGVSGQNYKIGIIPADGFYRIQTRAESGSGQWSSGRNATGGCISDAIVYLYKDSKYLIWGANGRFTGYISPSGNSTSPKWKSNADSSGVLGGGGACGGYSGESGGGGGGAGGHGTWRHTDAGYGGGGTGCIVGLENDGATLTESWSHGGFGVKTVEAMVLAGGGGSNPGDNDEPRTGGSGGGAWGNGGTSQYNSAYGVGPGGETFGKGESNNGWGYWAGPARGAWCIRDYSRSQWNCGVGIKSGSSCDIGTTSIYRIIQTSVILTVNSTPSGSNLKFITSSSNIVIRNTIETPVGANVRYYVSKAGYTPYIYSLYLNTTRTNTVALEQTVFDISLDMRYDVEAVETIYDMGLLTSAVTEVTNLKEIIPSVVESTDDCGHTSEQVEDTLDCGDFNTSTETIECGGIY